MTTRSGALRLLAIDPGLFFTGYAIFAPDPDARRDMPKNILLLADVLRIKNTLSIPEKLKFIYDSLNDMICDHEITDLALETPFLGKNAATFGKLCYIRGILLLLSQVHDLSLHQYPPSVIKKIITGNGHADKDSVARVMRKHYPLLIDARRTDVTDAASIGLCAIYLME